MTIGLDPFTDYRYLRRALVGKISGGPVGIESISASD